MAVKGRSCGICGHPAVAEHHIIYRSKWPEGVDVEVNKMPVCAVCHDNLHAKRVKVPEQYWLLANEEYGLFLLRRRDNSYAPLGEMVNSPEKLQAAPPAHRKTEEEIAAYKFHIKELKREKRYEAYLARKEFVKKILGVK